MAIYVRSSGSCECFGVLNCSSPAKTLHDEFLRRIPSLLNPSDAKQRKQSALSFQPLSVKRGSFQPCSEVSLKDVSGRPTKEETHKALDRCQTNPEHHAALLTEEATIINMRASTRSMNSNSGSSDAKKKKQKKKPAAATRNSKRSHVVTALPQVTSASPACPQTQAKNQLSNPKVQRRQQKLRSKQHQNGKQQLSQQREKKLNLQRRSHHQQQDQSRCATRPKVANKLGRFWESSQSLLRGI